MANIVDVSGSRRLQLGNEEFARTMAIGNRWSKIKIGVTLGFNGAATFSATMLMGLCSGTSNTYNAASTDGFVGVCPVQFTPDITWTYGAGPPDYYTNANPGKRVISKIGVTTTNTAGNGSQAWGVASAPTSLSMWVLTIFRGSPEYNSDGWKSIYVKSAHPINSGYTIIPMHTEDFAFYKNMENDSDSGSYAIYTNDAISTALNWTGPGLDSFSFVWNQASPTVEIGHIGIVRYQ